MISMLDLEYELSHGSNLGFDFVAGRVVYLVLILDSDSGFGPDSSFGGQKFDHNCDSGSGRCLILSGALVVGPDHNCDFGLCWFSGLYFDPNYQRMKYCFLSGRWNPSFDLLKYSGFDQGLQFAFESSFY